ncbi:Protein of unknown function [Gryllus bimaculatus]|nr:Protein of unknown function [Gryllus bimaculatus]
MPDRTISNATTISTHVRVQELEAGENVETEVVENTPQQTTFENSKYGVHCQYLLSTFSLNRTSYLPS